MHSTGPWRHWIPTVVTIAGGVLLLLHGPIAQPVRYNDFADQSVLFGIPHAADVFSNLGFAFVAVGGWMLLRPWRDHSALRQGWWGYRLFLIAVFLTALGSTYYHLAPDNARLVWDRIPIGVACAGLLAAVRAETRTDTRVARDAVVLTLLSLLSVAWWYYTDSPQRPGDVRFYLLLQGLTVVLIPLWQAIYASPRPDRIWFGVAVFLYFLAKLAELWDHELLTTVGWISGHTLKHLLATVAAGVLVGRLFRRVQLSAPLPEAA
jgi:predicted membrane channel-forming protein YqfA (hemolysin III family)